MTLMRLRELTPCPHHSRVLITLDEPTGPRRVTFYADADDARRLAREMARGSRACHPIFDFIHTLLATWHAEPVRVVLEEVNGDGIGALVYLRQGEVEAAIPCHPPDALTIALRAGLPIYATPEVLRHASRSPMKRDDTAQWLETVRPEDFGA